MRTPWIKLYVGDFIADTHQLTTLQFGAYVRLVHNYYQHGGLPEDDAQLARIAGLSAAEWRRESKVLRRFFKDGWRHARCEREMLGAQEAHQRRSRAGQAANEARWRSSHSNPNRIHTGSELEPEPEPEPEPESEET